MQLIIDKVRRVLVLEKLLTIHGNVRFWIASNPKEGGGVAQWLPLKKRHGRNTFKKINQF